MKDERYEHNHPQHRELMLPCYPACQMSAEHGQLYRHKRSGKEYAVWRATSEHVNYVGIRNGRNYGPIRGSNAADFAERFERIAGRAHFTSVAAWTCTVEKESNQ